MDADLIRKYRAVKALADTGSPGERENAARILAKLEERYPGIGAAAKVDAKRQPDLGADESWSIPPGVGVPGIKIDGWLRDMLGGLFDSLARDSGIVKLAKPVRAASSISQISPTVPRWQMSHGPPSISARQWAVESSLR